MWKTKPTRKELLTKTVSIMGVLYMDIYRLETFGCVPEPQGLVSPIYKKKILKCLHTVLTINHLKMY